jgi:hypothetical protein
VDAVLRCGEPEVCGVWLRLPDPGNPTGVFVRTIPVQDGQIALTGIAPGRYLAQGLRWIGWSGIHGISGEPLGEIAEVTVHADGKVAPPVVFGR